ASLLAAQDGGAIRGRVTDPQSGAVPDAKVRLYRQDTGAIFQTRTSPQGEFAFEPVASGSYLVEVEKEGFQSASSSITAAAGAPTRADIALRVAGVSESVLVTAAGVPQQLNEISKAVSTISNEEIRDRNEYAFSEILRMTPGVLISNGGGPG